MIPFGGFVLNNTIDVQLFSKMFLAGAQNLENKKEGTAYFVQAIHLFSIYDKTIKGTRNYCDTFV